MARRRDFIAEILERRSRHPKRTDRWLQFMKRGEGLLFALNHVGRKAPKKHSCQAELFRYFPVGIVAASEGYFRLVYRDLINFGDPYLRNAAQFKDLSLGHEAIYAIHERQASVGEIIAHQLSHNNLGDITRNMDALSGTDFKSAVEEELARRAHRERDGTMEPSWVSQFVVRTFELRHIFCHELATSYPVRIEEIDSCFRATFAFLFCTEACVQKLLERDA
jgi:hypothetical protein